MDIIGRLRGLLGIPGPVPERGETGTDRRCTGEGTGPDSVEYTDLLPLVMCRGRCAIVETTDIASALAFVDELGRFRAGIRAAQCGERKN